MAKRRKLEKPKMSSGVVISLPQPPLRNAEEYLKAYTGYVYTAVSAIAQEVASMELKLFKAKFTKKGPETTQIYEHEAISLLNYVNPITTLYDIIEATQVYLELTGEAFWVVLKEGKTPRELWLIRPDWVKVVPSAKEVIDHYTYHPGGSAVDKVKIPRENMIHFKYFHPLNPYRGKGSVQAAALPFDILNFAQEYNRNFFFNSALPGLIFTTDKKLNEKTIKRFLSQWMASYAGRSKSNKVAFLGGGLKVQKITQGAKELDFAEQQRMMRDDVLAVFKVPKTILGMTDDVNRANAQATTRAFMERVITPRMRKFVETLNEFFLPMYGEDALFFDFTDPSPEDVELKLKKYENALKFGWMTPNEVRAIENLEPVEGGDILLPLTFSGSSIGKPLAPIEEEEEEGKSLFRMLKRTLSKEEMKRVKKSKKSKSIEKPTKHMVRIPVKKVKDIKRENLEKALTKPLTKFIGDLLKVDKYNINKKSDEEADQPVFTEEGKDAYWNQFIETVTEREEEVKETAVALFKEQETLILENLDKEVKYWRKDRRKGKAGSVIPSVEVLSLIWYNVWLAAMREIFIEQGNYTLAFLGAGANIDITSEVAVEFLINHSGQLVTDINETTRTELMKTLAEGFEKGESIDELRRRVKDEFGTFTSSRAEMIARTEVLRASNVATVEAYRQSEVVEAKEWLAERDDRTCVHCQKMDGKTLALDKNYFDADDVMTTEGQKLTIGYAVGEPPLHPNCRCTTIPVLLGEKSKKQKTKVRE